MGLKFKLYQNTTCGKLIVVLSHKITIAINTLFRITLAAVTRHKLNDFHAVLMLVKYTRLLFNLT